MRLGWGGKGNYEYACARTRVRKSKLLTMDTYPKFLLMDLNEISRFLGETQYAKEMSELATRYDGVNLIELATSKNLAREYHEVLGFTTGELRVMIENYLGRWDAWNIITILRGKYYGASVEEIREDLVPAGKLKEDDLNQLLALGSVNEVMDSTKKFWGVEIPDEVKAAVDKGGILAPVEDYLDKMHYEMLLKSIPLGKEPQRVFLAYVRKEIDGVNLATLLKLKREGLSADRIMPFFIEGGAELKKEEFSRLAALENLDQVSGELSRYSFHEDIKDALEHSKVTGSMTDVTLAMQSRTLKTAEKMSHMYPLSVLPILDYIIRKKKEVDNIRIIARGKESGLDPELIKRLLVI